MLTRRSFFFVALPVLMGLAAGCQRKPPSMRNMTLESGRTQDTQTMSVSTHVAAKYPGAGEPEKGPAPPGQKPGPPAR